MRNLRIAHIADTHLGYRSSTVKGRDEDFSRSWILACQAIVDSKPDLILHAGDVFHHPSPSWGAVISFLEGAKILQDYGAPIFMISGNHDSSRMNMRHTVFSVLTGVTPFIRISHSPEPLATYLAHLDVTVVMLSHLALVNKDLLQNITYIRNSLNSRDFNILVSHGSVGDLDKSREIGSVVIPDEVFEFPWSYVALGHLHMAQPFGQRGWYSGSIERCGWSDLPASPAWTLTELTESELRHAQQSVPHRRMVELPDIDCEGWGPDDVVEAVLWSLGKSRLDPEGNAIVRVLLRNVPHREQRALQNFTRRNVKQKYPNMVFQPGVEKRSYLLDVRNDDARVDKVSSIEDMFREYLDSRTYVDPGFADRMLAKGLDLLKKASSTSGEDDTGDRPA